MAESAWIKHAKKYRRPNGSLDLAAAAKTYKKSGSSSSPRSRRSSSGAMASRKADRYGVSLQAQRANNERRRENRRRLDERLKIKRLEAEAEDKKSTGPKASQS